MADTPQEHAPGTDVETDLQEVDGSLILAGFPSELLVHLAETLGNPLALLVSKAHLSKAFREAARDAQGLLRHIDLNEWAQMVDDAAVAVLASNCSQLSYLNLHGCRNITDAAVVSVASNCKQLTTLNLLGCGKITDAAVVAVASKCTLLSSLDLESCSSITDPAVEAVASGCKQLTSLNLRYCDKITDAAVEAVTSGCEQLRMLKLRGNVHVTDAAMVTAEQLLFDRAEAVVKHVSTPTIKGGSKKPLPPPSPPPPPPPRKLVG